jgi:5-methylcytosine-specific restriction enzyme A
MSNVFRPNWLPKPAERKQAYRRFARDKASMDIYHSKQWQLARGQVLNRDEWECQHCHLALAQEVHHVIPLRECLKRGLDPYDLDNLISLCSNCHKKIKD